MFKQLPQMNEFMPDSSFLLSSASPKIALNFKVVDVTVIPQSISTFP